MKEQPKRILLLHPSAELYGADRTLLDLVTYLLGEGFEILVALPREGQLSVELRKKCIDVEIGPLGIAAAGDLTPFGLLRLALEIPRAIRFVSRLANQFRPDVIHTNTMVVLGGAIGAKIARATHLWHIHEIPTSPSWLPTLSAKLFNFLADQVVWNSHATGHTFLRHHGTLDRKSTVIHNGIDAKRLQPLLSKNAAREKLGWPTDAPVALIMGRINSWKGQTLAIDALASLQQRHPNLHLAIVGSPPPGQEHFDSDLSEHAREQGVENRILRHEFDANVGDFYAACDFVLLPSTRPEPFGLVVLEAFAAGRPVVASGHGGPVEILRPGRDGLLFEPNSAPALAASIGEMLDQHGAIEAMGANAVGHQQRHFSLSSHRQRFKRLYESLLHSTDDSLESNPRNPWPNVVHVVLGKANPERMNGVNRVVHGLANHQQDLAGRSSEVWGLCSDPDAPTPPRLYRLLTFPRYRRRRKIAPGMFARLHKIAEHSNLGTPVFHLHGAFLPEMSRIAAELRRLNLPYVFTPHGAYVPAAMHKRRMFKELYYRLFEAKLARGARAIQAQSPDEAKSLSLRFPNTKVVCVAPGQDLEMPRKPSTMRNDRELRIGSLGRLDQHTKGLDSLLDGLAQYVAEGGRVHLNLAGQGKDLESLQRRAKRLGIEEHITWQGEIHGPEKRRFFHGLDVFVQLSRHEGLPGAPLEAAACACPLLVTKATHLGPLIEKHGAGWVLADGNLDGVSSALRMAASQSDEQWSRIGNGARTMVQKEFSWKETARHMHKELYRLPLQPPIAGSAA